MNNLIVKKVLYVPWTEYEGNEYHVIGKKNGRECLFRFWRDKRNRNFHHYQMAYNASPYEVESILNEHLDQFGKKKDIVSYDLSADDNKEKANYTLKWLSNNGELEKPIEDCPLRTDQILYVYKDRKRLDPRMAILFTAEDYACVAEFKISKDTGWKNGAIVSPIGIWGKGQSDAVGLWHKSQNNSTAQDLMSDYLSFATMNNYICHEQQSLKEVGLSDAIVHKLFSSNQFFWSPQEEQPGIPDTFIPEVEYKAAKCYTIRNLWDKHHPRNRHGIFAWNDLGGVELVIKPN